MLKKFSWCNTNTGLLVLRIGVGAIFIFAGWMKLSDLQSTATMFATMGFGAFWAYLVTAVELVGGVAVLLGAFTRISSAVLAIVMIVAMYVLRSNPTMIMTPASVFFSCVCLALSGAGSFSTLDKNKN